MDVLSLESVRAPGGKRRRRLGLARLGCLDGPGWVGSPHFFSFLSISVFFLLFELNFQFDSNLY
jgi:hypothetical protein